MLANDPENTMVLFGLANEHLKGGNNAKAIEVFTDYLEKADDEGAAWGMLADAYEAEGETDKARESLEKGVSTALSHGHPTMAEEFKARLGEY